MEVKIGETVSVVGKDISGQVAYVGRCDFSSGYWVGLVLSEAIGKNNGTVNGKKYFECDDNHGLFVKFNQIKKTQPVLESALPVKRSSSKLEGSGRSSFVRGLSSKIPSKSKSGNDASNVETLDDACEEERVSVGTSSAEGLLKLKLADLESKVETLKMKRSEDKTKLTELSKVMIEKQQLMEYKAKMQIAHKELQKKLEEERMRAKEDDESEKERYEMAVLDKEWAEERCDALSNKVEKLEEELEKCKRSSRGSALGVAESNSENSDKLKQAVVKLRDLNNVEREEKQKSWKECAILQKENEQLLSNVEKLKLELKQAQSDIHDLKASVDSAMGAEEMIEALTNKCLEYEQLYKETKDQFDDLEKLYEMSEEIQESGKELEVELREENEVLKSNVSNLCKKLNDSLKRISVLEQSMLKYRDLTQTLRSENTEIKDLWMIEKQHYEELETSISKRGIQTAANLISSYSNLKYSDQSKSLIKSLKEKSLSSSLEKMFV